MILYVLQALGDGIWDQTRIIREFYMKKKNRKEIDTQIEEQFKKNYMRSKIYDLVIKRSRKTFPIGI